MVDLKDWMKGSADGRCRAAYDDQDAWSGAYGGQFDVERQEGPSGRPQLQVSDKDATPEQMEVRDMMDAGRDDWVDDRDSR